MADESVRNISLAPKSEVPKSSHPEDLTQSNTKFGVDGRLDPDNSPSGFEPELGGYLRNNPERTGLEPELGGAVRQNGVYVDEITCIGCKNCAHVARNTFYIEPDYGRARVIQQDGDPEETIQEAIDTCPVNCIHWVDYTELKQLERQRTFQVIKPLGFPVTRADSFKAEREQSQKASS